MYVDVKGMTMRDLVFMLKSPPVILLGYSLSSSVMHLLRLAMTYNQCQPMTVYIRTPSS